jgi:dGTPase
VFVWLRDGAPAGRRCVEAQVMDLADDVAYSVHDVEDAVVSGRLDPAVLHDPEVVDRLVELARGWYLPSAGGGELEAALADLQRAPYWVGEFDGGRRGLAALKDMTSQLIGRFCAAAEHATRGLAGPGPLTRYAADVTVPRETLAEIAVLKGLAALFVMTAEDRQPAYERQRTVVHELVRTLLQRAPEALEPAYAADWRAAADDAARLRVVVDQVAVLTDASAAAWHARLSG